MNIVIFYHIWYHVFFSNVKTVQWCRFNHIILAPTICGGRLRVSTTEGYFASTNYPNDYDYSKICKWELITDNNYAVQLKCNKFDVECYDKFVVYNGKSNKKFIHNVMSYSSMLLSTGTYTSITQFFEYVSVLTCVWEWLEWDENSCVLVTWNILVI